MSWYRENRARSRALFDLLAPEAYYQRPIALRHPIVFYEGHLPAFSFNTLVKRGLGRPGIDARLERSSRAASIRTNRRPRPVAAVRRRPLARPRSVVQAVRGRGRSPGARRAGERRYRAAGPSAARPRRGGALHPRARGDAPGNAAVHVAPPPVRPEARPAGYRPRVDGAAPAARVDRGARRVGDARRRTAATSRSGGTTSVRRAVVAVPAFRIERHNVTNARFLEFVDARRLPGPALVAARGLGVDAAGASRAPDVLGARRRAAGTGAACSTCVPLPPPGRST